MKKLIKTALMLMLVVGLVSACATKQAMRLGSVAQYSERIEMQLKEGDLRAAESTFGEMELYYPHAELTAAAQLKMVVAYYQAAEMDRVVVAAKRYVGRHPGAEGLDQAYYYSGMANYDRGLKYLADAAEEKSPYHARAARESFMALLRCCFESRHITEVSEKAAYLDETLAQYEFGLMRAALLDGNRPAAVAKGNSIIDSYPTTNAAGVAEVLMAAMDNPAALDRLLIATALTINQAAAEEIAAKGSATAAIAPAVAAADTTESAELMMVAEVAVTPTVPAAAAVDVAVVDVVADAAVASVAAAEADVALPVEDAKPAVADTHVTHAVVAEPVAGDGRFTVQMASSRSLAMVKRYVKRLGLADMVGYEPRSVNGEQWYAAYYGSYGDKHSAQQSANKLMAELGVKDLWVRPHHGKTVTAAAPAVTVAAQEPKKVRSTSAVKARAMTKYAIQISSQKDLASLKAEMREMNLDGKVEYHQRNVDNDVVYSALYGSYPNVSSARMDLPELQGRVNKGGLWIRAVDETHKLETE